jgi:hypothetical protein
VRNRLVTSLIVLSVLGPHLYAEEAPTPIRTSLTKVEFDFGRSTVSATDRSAQRKSPQRVSRDAAIFAGLTTLGLFAGMFVASKVALPCHCDDPESVVARGGLVGAVAGSAASIVITLR